MSGNLHLRYSIRSIRTRALILCVSIFIFELIFPLLASIESIEIDKMTELKTGFMEKIMGQDYFAAFAKYGLLSLGYYHPFLLVLFIVYLFFVFSSVITSELYNGTIGFILSRPISRRRIFLNLFILQSGGILIMSLSAFSATFIGMELFIKSNISVEPFITLVIRLSLLMLAIASLLAIIAALSNSSRSLFTYGSIMLAFFYLIDLLRGLWSPLELISYINPFALYQPFKVLTGQKLSVFSALLIVTASTAVFFFSSRIFEKRDLPGG